MFDTEEIETAAAIAANRGHRHWYNMMNQAGIGYTWALIKSFSKYFALSVPLINCSGRIQD
jgi:hypothetical protein